MINILSTLRFNIRAFGWRKGLRLPVTVIGNLRTVNIGQINICCPLRRGLIIIGTNHKTEVALYTLFNNSGVIDVHGNVYINFGTMLSNKGHIVFHGNNVIGSRSEIQIASSFEMGKNTILGYCAHVTDSNMHFMIDTESRQVMRDSTAIRLGSFNWMGSHCFIKRGTITPDYLTVASPNTLLCKDYSQVPPHSILAGAPARVLQQGRRRIFNYPIENALRRFFNQNPDQTNYSFADNVDVDELCAFSFSNECNRQLKDIENEIV